MTTIFDVCFRYAIFGNLRRQNPMVQSDAKRRLPSGEPNQRTILRLVALALSLHLAAAFAMSLLGAAAIFPTIIDSNGIGIGFAWDATGYRFDAIVLTQILRRRGIVDWLSYPCPFHTRLYSLSFALDPSSDFSVLSAEPVNALVYLSILLLVFKIGETVCDRRVGTLAAGIVAFWPSLFLHTTQPMKEPQLIVAILVIVLLSVRWLTKVYSLSEGLATSACGGVALVLIWLIRGKMWELVAAVVLLGTGMLIVSQLRDGRILAGNLLGAVLLLTLAAAIPRVIPRITLLPSQSGTVDQPTAEQPGMIGTSLPARIRFVRHAYATDYPQAGSNIDSNVEFNSNGDIARYLPRAIAIGFFAPFPDMWIVPGAQVGLKGRLLSGLETGAMYLIELLAIVSLWRRRKQLSAWLLILVSTIAVTTLGLVIVNLSVMYRMRYASWILLIVLGADGLRQIFSLLSSKKLAAEAAISPV